MRRVLFLCTANSCRSQMAEAMVKARYPDWQAFSAGAHPSGFVHPLAIRVLAEIGIEHRGKSKSVELFQDQPFDRIVTLCDEASEECPVWIGSGLRLHASFKDPARLEGTNDEKLAAFRQLRDELLLRIPDLLGSPAAAE